MTLQPQHTVNAPAILTNEQRQRVADAFESGQSVNTLRNYAGQFREWCEHEGQSTLPASPEVVAAYAMELADDGKSMSTVRLAVAAIVDAHRRAGLDSPVIVGVSETLRGPARQIGVSQKQAKPLDADSLAAIKATAFTPGRSRGGSMESESAALKCGQLDVALRRGTARLRGCAAPLARRPRCRRRCRSYIHRALQDRPRGRGLLRGDPSGDA